MGLSPFKNCSTNYSYYAPAPNPRPDRWSLLEKAEYAGGYVLRVKYHDCTNFEGVKVMVYRGRYTPRRSLDPHFHEGTDAPVARFRPDADGWTAACALARSFGFMTTNKYAKVEWTPADVQTLAPRMTEEQAEEWLSKNEGHIQDRLVELGWDVISNLLAYDGVDTGDADDNASA